MTNPFSVLIARGVAGIQEIRSFGYVLLHGWSSRYWRLLTPCGTRTVLNALRKSRRYMKMIVATASSFCRYRIRRSIFHRRSGNYHRLCAGAGRHLMGLITRGWYMVEIGSVFTALGLFSGIVGRMGISGWPTALSKGAKSLSTPP